MKKVFFIFLGLTIFSLSLTVLYLCMRAVMAVGGYCAEGGPYVIATHCPGGTGWLTPLSIFVMLGGGALYFIYNATVKNSPQWGYLFWSALFLALGWNFLELGLFHPPGVTSDPGWLICAVLFIIMGGGPLFAWPLTMKYGYSKSGANNEDMSLMGIIFGKKSQNPVLGTPFYESQIFLVLIHFIALAAGIYLGYQIFINS